MKNIVFLSAILLTAFLSSTNLTAGGCDPDSLDDVTITGVVDIKLAGNQEHYFLITQNDTFRLNFGPWWYEPDEGDAVRPLDGDTVVIIGGLNQTNPGLISAVIIVYEIDGQFWRNPFDPFWNNFDSTFSSDPSNFGDGISCGWPDSNISVELFTGTVLTDTTLMYHHYFLDADADGFPDFRLNFGPPWYEPTDSVEIPKEGDVVTLEGVILHTGTYPVIVVLTIDGQVWLDEGGFGPGRFGKWMKGNKNQAMTITSPFDSLTQIQFRNGWHHGSMPGSMYCQFLELHHQNMFEHQQHKAFAGFEIAMFNHQRQNMMFENQYRHGMKTRNGVLLQLHYRDSQLEQIRARSRDRIRLFYWDNNTGNWTEQIDITVDTSARLVTFEADTLHSFYMLTSTTATTAVWSEMATFHTMALRPNPAHHETRIDFTLPHYGRTNIALYSANGQIIRSVINAYMPAGKHNVWIATERLNSGTYYVVVVHENFRKTLPLIVIQ